MGLARHFTICPVCKSSLIFSPVRSQIDDTDWWRVEMFCPDCFSRKTFVTGRETVLLLLKHARHGREALGELGDKRASRSMEESAVKFLAALQKDFILPVDFGEPTEKDVASTRVRFYNTLCRLTGKEAEMIQEVFQKGDRSPGHPKV